MAQTQLSKEQSIEHSIRLINGQAGLPAFAHHMAELAKAMANESSSLNMLTNIILKNVSLTTVVLRAANSVYYNPGAKPILSVSRAVTMMGWDSVANLAAGLLIFDHFRNKSAKLQELILLMILTGNHARQIAIRCGMRRIEEAYLCGMFRNLGELMVACYLPAEYSKVIDGMKKDDLSEGDACERILKFRFEDLGKGMVHHWNLPHAVATCMDQPDLSGSHPSDLERLRIVSSFSHALSAVVYRTSSLESKDALKKLVLKYGPALPVRENEISAVLEAAVFETEDTLRAARLPVDRGVLSRQIVAATNMGSAFPAEQDPAAAPKTPGDSDILRNLMREIRSILESSDDFDLSGVLMMILEAMYRGGALDRALFCLVDSSRENIQARLGVGADVEALIEKFQFPISARSGPIGLAMLGKNDLIVDAGGSARYSRSAFMNVVGSPSFGILPLVVDDVAAGCLYFDSAAESFSLDAQKKEAFLQLRNFAVTAISRKRKNNN